ncbi:hypothetical protein [Lelliottia sp. CFBP8978]|uniref:hypothetical protein n=1 Tax=Lelliottia sp. CFBP8978 TaxID=3096522 RepID=UPI002A6B7088|nr:hypothetical protein [Lelliottia sp. CFBP8978]
MVKSTSSVCDVRKSLKRYVPVVTRICLAPLGFILVFILALLDLDFSHYAWSGYERSDLQRVIGISIDTTIALAVVILIYLLILKLTRTWSRNTVMTGITYLALFQVIFVIFSMSNLVMLIKNSVENILYYTGYWSLSNTLSPEVMTSQKELRDLLISVIYFLANTLISTLLTRLISRLFSANKE